MSKVRLFMRPILAALLAITVLAVTAQQTHAADRRDFTLINAHPSVTLTHVFVSAWDSADWGDDILGVDVLYPGESVDIVFSRFDGEAGNCLYDIKVIYEDGDEGYLYKVDLCSTTTVTFR